MEQSAEIILDSQGPFGNRITTFKLTFWRALLAEVNTHRMLSRNSASSRAIRFENMIKSVLDNPFIPIKWMKDHSGMQGVEYLDERGVELATSAWLLARNRTIDQAQYMNRELGVTKQICNRLLEPFMYHTCLLTGTEFENFTALRAEGMAEIHFQDLAFKMLDSMNKSEPNKLQAGEWHIPYGDRFDEDEITRIYYEIINQDKPHAITSSIEEVKIKIATTRCARISYVVPDVEQKIDYIADLKLHDRLASSGHMSAFEHCAKAMDEDEYGFHSIQVGNGDIYPGWCGNFRGFIQYRKMFENENRNDPRLLKK